jgi:MraZ protein
MFRGLHEHSIDAKGRLNVPARFREVLARQLVPEPANAVAAGAPVEQLIITTGIDPCLVAYTPAQWELFEARLASLSQFDPAVVQLKRIYVAGASECDIDKHGRLLIPPPLRQYAALEKDVVWAGMVTTIEIWAKEAWDTRMAASRQDRAAIARAMTELGL